LLFCQTFHSVCIDYDGNVFSFGRNNYGQLGIGVGEDKLAFTHIPQKVNVPACKQVCCGEYYVICLCYDGSVYSFGDNRKRQLGIGNNEDYYTSPQPISSLKDVEFISCGVNHTICKSSNNEIYSWGNNIYGQLGQGNIDHQNTPKICSSLLDEDVIDINVEMTIH